MEKTYKVHEIKAMLEEAKNEVKAKLGNNVDSGNEKINQDSYKESEKRMKDFNKNTKMPEGAKYKKADFNRTLLDVMPEDLPENYKERVKSQVMGYTSEAEKNNGIEKSGDFETNKDIYDEFKKSGEEYKKNKTALKKSGLQAREWPDKVFDTEKNIYENNIKIVSFKKTEFITENHMKSKIPDDFKIEGKVFYMKDKNRNSYLIEWSNGEANILEHSNPQGMDESVNRMRALYNYTSKESEKMNNKDRINESNSMIENMLNKVRKLKVDE